MFFSHKEFLNCGILQFQLPKQIIPRKSSQQLLFFAQERPNFGPVLFLLMLIGILYYYLARKQQQLRGSQYVLRSRRRDSGNFASEFDFQVAFFQDDSYFGLFRREELETGKITAPGSVQRVVRGVHCQKMRILSLCASIVERVQVTVLTCLRSTRSQNLTQISDFFTVPKTAFEFTTRFRRVPPSVFSSSQISSVSFISRNFVCCATFYTRACTHTVGGDEVGRVA